MNAELLEHIDVDKRFHDGAPEGRTQVDLSASAVTKAEPDGVVANVASFDDVIVHVQLLQWRDALERFALPRQLPVLQQFCLVKVRPFKNEAECTSWQLSVDRASLDLNRCFVLAVDSVKVRDAMFAQLTGWLNRADLRRWRHR